MSNVLLVDDDVELTELLSELLGLESFNVDIAYNGMEALQKLEQKSYDIVLLDVMMPVLNGIDTLKKLRQKYDIPVLMLTARGNDIDRVLGLELGADDYLPKPFNDRELIARIKAILRRFNVKSSLRPELNSNKEDNRKEILFDGLLLHKGHQQVMYNGESLDFTGTEYALLEILIRNPGTILSREMLSLEVLGKRLTPFDRAIDMHMSNIRRKLPQRANGLPWFKTLRGKGYLLVTNE
ncbi:two-component system response regulator CpxR [Cricetibacter osteomyelitidis]|uniref:Two-component system response regulator CpxR n=1 Tax=Cricetibacter osteomyelitidis TaxID=1521931 RepID=A0A4R2T668_9PAST|nr:response regulator [Cricetibacter osteomyelitidis]TCP96926.1 two-component system response regulator CpxR [Cricetibacter osteomyelitidis]